MENYYIFMFTLLTLLTKNKKTFALTVVCWCSSVYSNPLGEYFSSIGMGFYVSCLSVEIYSLVLALMLYPLHKCKLLPCVFVSTSTYVVACMVTSGMYYEFLREYYYAFNIFMFECMIFLCIVNSKIKDWIDKVQDKIIHKFKSKFSYPEKYLGWKGYL